MVLWMMVWFVEGVFVWKIIKFEKWPHKVDGKLLKTLIFANDNWVLKISICPLTNNDYNLTILNYGNSKIPGSKRAF